VFVGGIAEGNRVEKLKRSSMKNLYVRNLQGEKTGKLKLGGMGAGNWGIGKIKDTGRQRREKSERGKAGISSSGNGRNWESECRDKQDSNLTAFAF
jgi:hypothetical protein